MRTRCRLRQTADNAVVPSQGYEDRDKAGGSMHQTLFHVAYMHFIGLTWSSIAQVDHRK